MKKFCRIVFPLLTLGWMGLIFFLSSQTATESSDLSGSFIESVLKFFWADFEKLPFAEQTEILEGLSFIVRKSAHATAYFILGVFASLSLSTYSAPPLLLRALFSQIICVGYAASDEYHQLFVDGRSGELRDVIIDSVGSLLAVLLIYSITALVLKKGKNKNRKSKNMKKKDLIRLNEELFHRNEQTLRSLEDIKNENKQLLNELEALRAQMEELKKPIEQEEEPVEQEKTATPLENLKEKMIEANLPNDTKYGAEIIGKIVVSAATHCNNLSFAENSAENKELINLILGRTEVAKAEILSIVSSATPLEEKISLIDAQRNEAEDYFNSVLAQKD